MFGQNAWDHVGHKSGDPKNWKKRSLAQGGPTRPGEPKANPRRPHRQPTSQKKKSAKSRHTKRQSSTREKEHNFEGKNPNENAHVSPDAGKQSTRAPKMSPHKLSVAYKPRLKMQASQHSKKRGRISREIIAPEYGSHRKVRSKINFLAKNRQMLKNKAPESM